MLQSKTARHLKEFELAVLFVSTIVVVASIVLQPSPTSVSLFGYTIPDVCYFKGLTSWNCFGCGLTRSITYMGHLDPVSAFKYHWAGPFLYVGFVFQIPIRLRNLIRLKVHA